MPLLGWHDSFAIDKGKIDEQHKGLMALINQLHDAHEEERAKGEIHEILEGLIEYAETHFADEEAQMSAANYPELEAHRLTHARFVNKVLSFRNRYEEGEDHLSMEILGFMKTWWSEHIMHEDRGYKPYLPANA